MGADLTTITISSMILSLAIIYVMFKILDINFFNYSVEKMILGYGLMIIYLTLSYNSTMLFLRYLSFIFVLTIIFFLILKNNTKEIFIASFLTFILIIISEFIFAVLVLNLLHMEVETFFGMIISNFSIGIIMVVLTSIKPILKLFHIISNKLVSSSRYYVISIIIAVALSASIIVYINYFDISAALRFVLSIIAIMVYTFITTTLFIEKNQNDKMQYQYELALNNLKEYERILDIQKVSNHENKNQLLVIKSMISKQNKKAIEYIDSVLLEKKEDDEDFLYKTNTIPSGGLRGLIYYKLLLMKEKNINIDLSIPLNIRKINLEKFGVNFNRDLCKILGVILDNSIQAVSELNEKNIEINFIFNDEKLIISVSNNYEGSIDLSMVDKMKYTTKGSGHGYGLTLLNQLVDKNDLITNERYICGKSFVQKIIITIKNSD